MKKVFLITIVVVLVVAIFLLLRQNFNNTSDPADPDIIGIPDPLETISEFYNDWHDALWSTSTNPYDEGFDKDSRLSDSVQDYISNWDEQSTTGLDPVICQYIIPKRVGVKLSYNQDGKAQFLALPRGSGPVPERAVVDMSYLNGNWLITGINCVSGESAPEREFEFEKEGFLLKNNEPPLDPDTWYVIYEENGFDGHFAPLFLSAKSVCVKSDDVESVCDSNNLQNTSKAVVKGDMTETGITVKRIEILD